MLAPLAVVFSGSNNKGAKKIMANVFQNTELVVRDAAIELHGALVAAALIPDKIEAAFTTRKVGQTVNVTKRPIMTANRHTGTGAFTTSDVTEVSVPVKIVFRSYVKHKLTAAEKTYDIDDFNIQVVRPAMVAIAQDIDLFLIHNILVPGFARNVAGTDGVDPSTLAHLAAGWKKMFDSKLDPKASVGILDSQAAANFLQLDQFISKDYGDERPNGLRQAILAQVYGTQMYPSNSAATQARGNIAGTVLTNGVPVLAATTLAIDGLTDQTSVIWKGARFSVAGDTQVYTIKSETADNVPAAGAVTVSIYPAVSADLVSAASGSAVTFETALKENVLFHPDAVARAIIAPEPFSAMPSSVGEFEGLSIRTSLESTMNNDDTGDGDYILFDTYLGANVIVEAGGVILQG